MNILYICEESNLKNGWAVVAYHTIKQAAEHGHSVIVITKVNAANLPIDNVTYLTLLPNESSVALPHSWKLLRELNNCQYDLIHILVETYISLLFFSVIKKSYLTAHGTYAINLFTKSRLRAFYKLCLNKITAVICVSTYTEKMFKKHVGYNTTYVCTSGVDTTHFSSRIKSTEKELSFCLIGHLKERKGTLLAIKATELLIPQFPQLKLVIAGSDKNSFSEICKKYVTEKKLQKNVIFKGRVDDEELLRIYSSSIGNILPSFNTVDGSFEGYGLIHLEANAMGLPSIGSKDTGNESVIKDGFSGFLAEQGNIEDIASKMRLIIELFQNGSYPEFSSKVQSYAKEKTWNKYFENLQMHYH